MERPGATSTPASSATQGAGNRHVRSLAASRLRAALFAGAVGGAALLVPGDALAQSNPEGNEVASSPKGIVGGAMLGGEVVMMVEAALGVQPWWAYLIGGVAGAGAGGAGGWLTEGNGIDARVPMGMLLGGVALIIPTAISIISATQFARQTDYTEDKGPAAYRLPRRPAGGFVAVQATGADREVALSVPAVGFGTTFTDRERAELGLPQAPQVRVPVLVGSF